MRFPWRPVLALGVLVGSFALIAALGLGYAGLGAYALTAGRLTSAVRMLLPAAVILLALALALRAALRVRVEPRGVRVEREDQPELWAVVDELAEIARTRGPDEIRVVSDVDIAVWEEPKLLGLLPGRRYLEIGLPLLAGLSVGELRAALAHE
ncbi:MAG TPA: M48 family metallopeptidase, partial [Pseudonocardiaceae bacterium]